MQGDALLGALFERGSGGSGDVGCRPALPRRSTARCRGSTASPRRRTSGARRPSCWARSACRPRRRCAGCSRVARPVPEMEFAGETPAEPGVRRHWVASFFPIDGGVGGVVVEDTERHRATQREHDALRSGRDRPRPCGGAHARDRRRSAPRCARSRVLAGLVEAAVPDAGRLLRRPSRPRRRARLRGDRRRGRRPRARRSSPARSPTARPPTARRRSARPPSRAPASRRSTP